MNNSLKIVYYPYKMVNLYLADKKEYCTFKKSNLKKTAYN